MHLDEFDTSRHSENKTAAHAKMSDVPGEKVISKESLSVTRLTT